MDDLVRWSTASGDSSDGGDPTTTRELALIDLVHRYEAEIRRGTYASVPHDLAQALTTPSAQWRRIITHTHTGLRFGVALRPRAALEPVEVPGAWRMLETVVLDVAARADADFHMERLLLPDPVAALGWWRDEDTRAGVIVPHIDLGSRDRKAALAALRGHQPQRVALAPAALGLATIGLLAAVRKWAAGSAKAVPGVAALATSAAVSGAAAITFVLAPAITPFGQHLIVPSVTPSQAADTGTAPATRPPATASASPGVGASPPPGRQSQPPSAGATASPSTPDSDAGAVPGPTASGGGLPTQPSAVCGG
jgi:hypothetical protein